MRQTLLILTGCAVAATALYLTSLVKPPEQLPLCPEPFNHGNKMHCQMENINHAP